MKRVILTGARGFIGAHCIEPLLKRGYEIHAVTSRTPVSHDPRVIWHQADLLDTPTIAALVTAIAPTHLLHLAWYVEHGKFWTSLENYRWVQASLQLVWDFANAGGRRVVVGGTCYEYDHRYGYCVEDWTPQVPKTLYGTSKHSLNMMLKAFAENTDLSAAWGHIFFTFGAHERPNRLVASVIRSLLRNEPAPCSHGNQMRDFLYVEDLADALVALLDSDVIGSVNLGSGTPVAIKDLVTTIGQSLNRPDLIQLGALTAAANDPPMIAADVRRLRQEVGWTPAHTLLQGIDKTISWWQGQSS